MVSPEKLDEFLERGVVLELDTIPEGPFIVTELVLLRSDWFGKPEEG